jgi:hypothetical protein
MSTRSTSPSTSKDAPSAVAGTLRLMPTRSSAAGDGRPGSRMSSHGVPGIRASQTGTRSPAACHPGARTRTHRAPGPSRRSTRTRPRPTAAAWPRSARRARRRRRRGGAGSPRGNQRRSSSSSPSSGQDSSNGAPVKSGSSSPRCTPTVTRPSASRSTSSRSLIDCGSSCDTAPAPDRSSHSRRRAPRASGPTSGRSSGAQEAPQRFADDLRRRRAVRPRPLTELLPQFRVQTHRLDARGP